MDYQQRQKRKILWRRAYMKRRRAMFQAKGICVSCQVKPAKEGRVSCEKCLMHKKTTESMRKYGISSSSYESLGRKQRGKCAICRREKKLVRDHCHKKLHFRGLLCTSCNVALGLFMDSPKILNAAIKYLSTHKLA